MNRIYSVVWCHVRHIYIVASELASRKKIKGKLQGHLNKNNNKKRALLLTLLGVFVSQAVSLADNQSTENYDSYAFENVIEISKVAQDQETSSQDHEEDLDEEDTNKIKIPRVRKEGREHHYRDYDYQQGIVLGDDIYIDNDDYRHTMVVIGNKAGNFDANSVVIGYQASGEANNVVALGHEAQAYGNNSIAIGAGSVADIDNSVSIGNGDGDSKERLLTGLSSGQVTRRSRDAINGTQFYNAMTSVNDALGAGGRILTTGEMTDPNFKGALKADNDIDTVYKGFEYLTKQLENAGGDSLLQLSGKQLVIDNVTAKAATEFDLHNFDEENNKKVTRKLTGISAGIVGMESVDAINGAQLYAVNSSIATILGGDSVINADGTILAPKYDFNKAGETDEGKIFNNVGSALTHLDGRVVQNSSDITEAQTTINTITTDLGTINSNIEGLNKGTAGLLQLSGKQLVIDNVTAKAATEFDLHNFDEENNKKVTRKLTGISAGIVGMESVDAINGSQLHAANSSIATALGGDSVINADGTILAPKYDFNKAGETDEGKIFNNVDSALTHLDGRVVQNSSDITEAQTTINTITTDIGTINSNIEGLNKGTAGLLQLSGKQLVIDNVTAKAATEFDLHNFDEDNNKKVTRKLTGISAGIVGMESVDAINGSQLHAANSSIATALGGDSVINADGTILAPKYDFNKAGETDEAKIFNNVGSALTHLDGRVVQNSSDITEAQTTINTITTDIGTINSNIEGLNKGTAGLLQLSGKQLVIDNVTAKAATEFDLHNFDEENNKKVTRKLTGISAGIVGMESVDAINGAQLYAVNSSIATILGGGSNVDVNGILVAPNYKEALNSEEDITSIYKGFEYLSGQLTNVGGRDGILIVSGSKITIDNNVAKLATEFDFSNQNRVTRKVTGITAGNLSDDSVDAINGSQLHSTNQNLAKTTGNVKDLATALGGGAKINAEGKLEGPSYKFKDGNKYTTVGDALGNLDERVDGLGQDVAGIQNKISGIEVAVEGINNGTAGIVQIATDYDGNEQIVLDPTIAGNSDTFNIGKEDGERTLAGVADGTISERSKEAVNAGQLYGMADDLGKILGTDVSVDDNGFVYVNSSFNVGQQDPTDFTVSGALQHLKNQISESEGQGLFAYDSDKNQIILADDGKINAETTVDFGSRKVGGIAAVEPVKDSEYAVNGHQLWETNQKVDFQAQQIDHINSTLGHYNTRINNVERTVHQNRKVASAGISSAMAMSSIPYVENMKYSFGMGAAGYDGEAAMSVGFSFKIGSDARFKIQGSYDTQNKVGVGVGFAYGF